MFDFYYATLCKLTRMWLRCSMTIGHGVTDVRLNRSAGERKQYDLLEGDMLPRYGFVAGVHNNDVALNRSRCRDEVLHARPGEIDAVDGVDQLVGAAANFEKYPVLSIDSRQGVECLPVITGRPQIN